MWLGCNGAPIDRGFIIRLGAKGMGLILLAVALLTLVAFVVWTVDGPRVNLGRE